MSVLFAELNDKERANNDMDIQEQTAEASENDIETPPMLTAEDKEGRFNLPQVDSMSL
jgi:hypothetical protein